MTSMSVAEVVPTIVQSDDLEPQTVIIFVNMVEYMQSQLLLLLSSHLRHSEYVVKSLKRAWSITTFFNCVNLKLLYFGCSNSTIVTMSQ